MADAVVWQGHTRASLPPYTGDTQVSLGNLRRQSCMQVQYRTKVTTQATQQVSYASSCSSSAGAPESGPHHFADSYMQHPRQDAHVAAQAVPHAVPTEQPAGNEDGAMADGAPHAADVPAPRGLRLCAVVK